MDYCAKRTSYTHKTSALRAARRIAKCSLEDRGSQYQLKGQSDVPDVSSGSQPQNYKLWSREVVVDFLGLRV